MGPSVLEQAGRMSRKGVDPEVWKGLKPQARGETRAVSTGTQLAEWWGVLTAAKASRPWRFAKRPSPSLCRVLVSSVYANKKIKATIKMNPWHIPGFDHRGAGLLRWNLQHLFQLSLAFQLKDISLITRALFGHE